MVQEQLATAAAKKKKKRRNKKKAAAENGAGSDNSDDSDAEFTPKQSTAVKRPVNGAVVEDSSLGPNALLVNACVKQGFKPDEVHAAISFLFENNKDYDSVEAIMRHLRGEEDFEEAFVPSPITSFPNAVAPSRAKTPVVEPLPREEEVVEEEEEEEAPPAVPLETRLEMAVSHDDLEASLGALNAFIGLAKEQQEWAEQRKPLFGSRTLELLMTNLLTQSVARPSEYPAQLQGGLQKLLQHLLGTSTILPELLTVIAHTQKLNSRSALSASSMQKIGGAIATTIRDYSERLDSSAEGAVELPLLEARLTNTTCARVSKTAAPKELFALRESRVEAVGNYKKACGIMLGSLSTALPVISSQRKPNSESLLETLLKESLQVSSSGLKDKRAQVRLARTIRHSLSYTETDAISSVGRIRLTACAPRCLRCARPWRSSCSRCASRCRAARPSSTRSAPAARCSSASCRPWTGRSRASRPGRRGSRTSSTTASPATRTPTPSTTPASR